MLQMRLFRLLRSLSLCFFVSILILFQLATLANSAQLTLAWDPNTEPDVAGYRVYYGLLSDQYSNSVDVGNQTSYTLSNLPDGKTYYMAATAYDREVE
jgi:fibronectin type 3 domain-containing protein